MSDIVRKLRYMARNCRMIEKSAGSEGHFDEIGSVLDEAADEIESWRKAFVAQALAKDDLRDSIQKMRLCSLNRDWKTFDEISLKAINEHLITD
jgi:hypothetical protein